MRWTVDLCLRHGIAIGAHPSFVDREHFGRRELGLGPGAIHLLVLAQVRRLAAICDAAGNATGWTDERILCSARYARLTANGPAGNLRADQMHLTLGDKGYLLVFNGGVRLIYQPPN